MSVLQEIREGGLEEVVGVMYKMIMGLSLQDMVL